MNKLTLSKFYACLEFSEVACGARDQSQDRYLILTTTRHLRPPLLTLSLSLLRATVGVLKLQLDPAIVARAAQANDSGNPPGTSQGSRGVGEAATSSSTGSATDGTAGAGDGGGTNPFGPSVLSDEAWDQLSTILGKVPKGKRGRPAVPLQALIICSPIPLVDAVSVFTVILVLRKKIYSKFY